HCGVGRSRSLCLSRRRSTRRSTQGWTASVDRLCSPQSYFSKGVLMTGSLQSKVAVVTGASRGAGRGIALALGEAGAIVYVTGRSVRGKTTTENLPGTIEDT